MSTYDRFELSQLSLEALRERAAELSIAGYDDLERVMLVEAIVARYTALAPTSGSVAWIRRLPTRKPDRPVAKEPSEPTTIFIDRGLPVPDSYPGTRLRVLIRDPETLFVYWESATYSAEGWEISAFDSMGSCVFSFRSSEPLSGFGYILSSVERVKRVSLRPIKNASPAEELLAAQIAPPGAGDDRIPDNQWVDIRTSKPVEELPDFATRELPEELRSWGSPGAHPSGSPAMPWSADRPQAPSSWSTPLPSSGTLKKG